MDNEIEFEAQYASGITKTEGETSHSHREATGKI